MLSHQIKAFLNEHTSLKYDEPKNKVVCQLTKHEMPLTVQAIETYVKGKKYQKAVKKTFDFNQYKPHIVPSTKRNHLHELFCFLTLRHVARTQPAVERHVQGKRYKKAFARWTKCQETGEKFVPRGRQRKKVGDSDSGGPGRGGAHNWSDDSVDEDNTDDDDLEDLYPAEVFGRDNEDEEEDGDEDDDDDDDDDENSNENESSETEDNTSAPTKTTGKSFNEDGGSDYDMDIMNEDGAGDGSRDSTSRVQVNIPKGHKKKGKKKEKNLMKANGDSSKKSNLHNKKEKSRKRKSTTDSGNQEVEKKKKKK